MKNLRRSSRRGFALLLTLIIVSFAAAIAVLFLLNARQERTGTDSYAQGSRVRQLADTAVNIAMGQINAATREGTATIPVSWASQPGMIRTYNTTGKLSNVYKLYSWSPMTEAGSGFSSIAAAELPPGAWATQTAQYVDLNSPVNGIYPIMDPAIANSAATLSAVNSLPQSQTTPGGINWDFPSEVAYLTGDPKFPGYSNANTTNVLPMPVQWLYVLQDGTWVSPTTVAGGVANFDPALVKNGNPIIGRIAFWTDDETDKVNLNTAGEGAYWDWPKAASQDEMQFSGNPPARNEFYRFSGNPATTSLSAIFPELLSGTTTPGSGFSRWSLTGAGPANPTYLTGMETILGKGGYNDNGYPPGFPPGLTPRLMFGNPSWSSGSSQSPAGSQGGVYPAPYYQTYNPTQSSNSTGAFSDGSAYKAFSAYSPVVLNSYRLYATPDELFYAPPVTNVNTGSRGSGAPAVGGFGVGFVNPALSNATVTLTAQQVSQRLFLTTTDSRAPETTLFNTPRVSLWPVTWPFPSDYYIAAGSTGLGVRGAVPLVNPASPSPTPDTSTLATLATTKYNLASTPNCITPQEDLIAFCSTLNTQATTPNPYYFQRQNPNSSDFDWSNIKRNRFLANYVRGMVGQSIPGFGDSLEHAWNFNNPSSPTGTVADWITLECMDYSRSMVNQYTWDPNDSLGNLMYSFTGVAGSQERIAGGNKGAVNERNALSATPLRIAPGSSGLSPNFFDGTPPHNAGNAGQSDAYVTQGSFPSLKEVAVEFIATQRLAPAYLGPTAGPNAAILSQDPFYWANLINPGPALLIGTSLTYPDEIGPAVPAITATTPGLTAATGTVPDGKATDTGVSNNLEKYNMYPVGAQTTYMQAILLFDFAQLRDGINASPNPQFWIKVTGQDAWAINGSQGVYFTSPLKGEFKARTGAGASDTVFQTLYGKTFDPTASASQSVWPLCSTQIQVSPSDVTFTFNGAPITVALYAEYPSGNSPSITPDTDPTGDPKQFITSYKVDFHNWSGPQPIPIAPRWNVRQARQVVYPNPGHVLVTYTTGSPMPVVTATFPPYPESGTTSWVATEMVPDLQNIGGWNWSNIAASTAPNPATDHTEIRDINSGWGYPAPYGADSGNQAPLDSLGSSGTQWMMYACAYNSGSPAVQTNPTALVTGSTSVPIPVTAPPTPVTNGWSCNMTNRLASISGTIVAAEGTPPVSSGTSDVGLNAGPLWTNTGFNSGGGGVPNYAPEAYTEITPYDTVMSAMVDPSPGSNGHVAGDPRLANVLGENLAFDASKNVLANLGDSTPPVPSMVLNGNPPLWIGNQNLSQYKFKAPPNPYQYGVDIEKSSSPFTVYNGFRYFPRLTYQAQSHQLGNPASLSMMTGYQLVPVWSRSLPTAAGRGSTTSSSTSSNGFALEGVFGGASGLGSSQGYSTEVGLDTNAFMYLNPDWDWTSSPGNAPDGGFIERPDQDYQTFFTAATYGNGLGTPYFSRSGNGSYSSGLGGIVSSNVSMFSPNRQVPSPIILGTLPSSLTQGWQTLAFCPNPASVVDQAAVVSPAVVNPGVLTPTNSPTDVPYTANSNGSKIPDHLLLDLFWMPVGEPYPISEEFSTAGKVNLNYEMMPFPYIQRKSGLDAVLKSVWIYAIPDTVLTANMPQDYKSWYFMSTNSSSHQRSYTNTRYPINVNTTLAAFDYKFQQGDLFRSASQLCDMFLYPNDPATANTLASTMITAGGADTPPSTGNIVNWWKTYGMLTSDNGREAPYNAIYSRITTQSNTFTVHWRVQALHQVTPNGTVNATWTDGFDRVTSELRGATLIERYIDPNAGSSAANSIPDYADPSVGPTANPITYYYKWRIDNETYFQPGP